MEWNANSLGPCTICEGRGCVACEWTGSRRGQLRPDPYLSWCAEVGEWMRRAGTPFVHGLADLLRDLYDRDMEPQEAAMTVQERAV